MEQNRPRARALSAQGVAYRMGEGGRPYRARRGVRAACVIVMTLPWPPSVNSYWRHPTTGALAGRHLISEEGRRYRTFVAELSRVNRWNNNQKGRLVVVVMAYPPDRRRRDLDNILKALLDSITHAGVIEDDSQIDDLRIVRRQPKPNGEILLTICESEIQ